MAESKNIMTPEFRVSFAHVFRPQANPQNPAAEKKFSLACLFPHPSKMTPSYKKEYEAFVAKIKAEINQAIAEKWGAKKPANLRMPFRDQGEKTFDGYEAGAVWFNASSKQKPGLVDANNNDIIDETAFYSGCYARATLRVYAYDASGNRGVGIGLQNVQKLRDGEPLSGRLKAQDEFEPVAGAEEETAVVGAGGAVDLLS